MSDEHLSGRDAARAPDYRHVVEHIQDAVVEFEFVDGDPIVRAVNEAFVDVFGYAAAGVVGESLNDWIVPDWRRDEAERLDEQTAAGAANHRHVTRVTADGLREFLYRSVPYRTERTTRGGFALYTDLTELSRNRRRMRVLNRVLRHNLRNRATVVLGHTTTLLDAVDERTDEHVAAAAAVERAARDLERLAAEAGDVRRLLDGSDAGDTVDVVPLARRVVADHHRREPDAVIEAALPDSLVVAGNAHLETALDALVENAIRHNPAAEPRVRVSARPADATDWARIEVADDGPPIPADERAVVAGETDVTPTRHASGLGLWLVAWAAETFGGDLSFAESDLGGNLVRVRLPAV